MLANVLYSITYVLDNLNKKYCLINIISDLQIFYFKDNLGFLSVIFFFIGKVVVASKYGNSAI